MLSRHTRSTTAGYRTLDQDIDRLIVRIRRLAVHRGYDRDALMSPMLKRLMPPKRANGDAATETAELHARLTAAGLDDRAVVYLTQSVETELDFARLRLT